MATQSGFVYVGLAVLTACILAGMTLSCTQGRESAVRQLDERIAAELSHRLQQLLDDLVAEQSTVRSGLLLVEGPGFRWKGASGVAFEATATPILPDDQFAIDSVAKSMTATLVMLLVEDERIGLDHSINRYLPHELMDGLHVIQGQSYSDQITVRHLLNHTSGIPDDWACGEFLNLVAGDLERRWTPQETVDYVKTNCEPEFAPGERFAYSDTGYNLLGLIIEQVTGMPLHQAFRELLLDPQGLDHSYRPAYEQPRPSIPDRPPSERFFGDVECSLAPAVMTADWGGGGLISTTEDLNRFLRAFVDNRIFRDPGTRNMMLTWVDSGPFHGYGFGFGLIDYDRSESPAHAGLGQVWGHAGSSQVFMYYWPRHDVTLVGTLNQIDAETNRYDLLAAIMSTLEDALAVS